MAGFSLKDAPEVFVSTTSASAPISRAVKAGKLRKLGSRLYATNLTEPPEALVRRHCWQIAAGFFPGALVADRTALELRPAPDGSVFLVAAKGNAVALPGVKLRPRRGIGPRRRHRLLMQGRSEVSPGVFKDRPNQFGTLIFVMPDEVQGTLTHGFRIYQRLSEPLHRAVFVMFLVSKVHPFIDGNGRIARIMMNAELVAAQQARVVIPIIYRSNYLSALRALSGNAWPEPIIRTLAFAQRYVAVVPWEDLEVARAVLARTNAFVRPEVGDEEGIRLRIPDAADIAAAVDQVAQERA